MATEDRGISLGAWMELVRRARVGTERKLALLAVGSYADADGAGIYCGVARLAADCEVSHRTASRYLTWMRDVGFIELVERGNRRRGKADRYRLIIDPELPGRIDLPDPDEYRKIVGEIAGAKRAETRQQQTRARARSMDTDDDHKSDMRDDGLMDTHVSPDESPAEDGFMDTQVSTETRFRGHEAPTFMDTMDVPPPFIDHLTSQTDLPWERVDLRSPRLLSARETRSDDEDSSPERFPVMVGAGPTPPLPRWTIGRGGVPLPAFERVEIQRDGPTCACGVLLEPDGLCFACGR